MPGRTTAGSRLIPINPVPPLPFGGGPGVKYLRTIATQLSYWPLLFRELRQADVVHVFSAFITHRSSGAAPSGAIAKLFGRPVVFNYHSGEAPDHLTVRIVRHVMRTWVDLNVVPSIPPPRASELRDQRPSGA